MSRSTNESKEKILFSKEKLEFGAIRTYLFDTIYPLQNGSTDTPGQKVLKKTQV